MREVLTLLTTRGLKYRNNEARILSKGIPILQKVWTTRERVQEHTMPGASRRRDDRTYPFPTCTTIRLRVRAHPRWTNCRQRKNCYDSRPESFRDHDGPVVSEEGEGEESVGALRPVESHNLRGDDRINCQDRAVLLGGSASNQLSAHSNWHVLSWRNQSGGHPSPFQLKLN
jgi:hypothetical protein